MKLDEQLVRINEKLQLILNQFLLLKKENAKIKQELKELKQINSEKSTTIENLIQKVEILQASKSNMTDDERRDFEKRINRYLKEVEKCISLIQK
jgi:GTPase involved in cell partitioning and DNA repair